jgi:hypothetical protein
MKKMIVVILSLWCLVAGDAAGQEVSVKSLPPSVVKTVPQCGDTGVEAGTTQIKVTFSKEMMDGAWSWTQLSNETFPQISGKPRYLEDKKTCVIDVKLEPNKTYVIWLNSKNAGNFKDADGISAVPYLLVFTTK